MTPMTELRLFSAKEQQDTANTLLSLSTPASCSAVLPKLQQDAVDSLLSREGASPIQGHLEGKNIDFDVTDEVLESDSVVERKSNIARKDGCLLWTDDDLRIVINEIDSWKKQGKSPVGFIKHLTSCFPKRSESSVGGLIYNHLKELARKRSGKPIYLNQSK